MQYELTKHSNFEFNIFNNFIQYGHVRLTKEFICTLNFSDSEQNKNKRFW